MTLFTPVEQWTRPSAESHEISPPFMLKPEVCTIWHLSHALGFTGGEDLKAMRGLGRSGEGESRSQVNLLTSSSSLLSVGEGDWK